MKPATPGRRNLEAILSAAAAALLIYLALRLLATDGAGFRSRRLFNVCELGVIVNFAMAALLIANVYRVASKGRPIEVLGDGLHHPSWRRPIPFAEIERVLLKREPALHGGHKMQVSLLLRSGAVQLLPSSLLPAAPTRFAKRVRAAMVQSTPPPR
jgi:hypothetical protein